MAGPEERITLLVTTDHCIGGGRDVVAGDVLSAPGDVSLADARARIARGWYTVIDGDVPPGPIHPAVETREPTVEKRDPEIESPPPSRTTGKKTKGRGKGKRARSK